MADYQFAGGSLTIDEPSGQTLERYELLTGITALNGKLIDLKLEQTERCIDELVRDESSAPVAANLFMLTQHFEISKWRIQGTDVATASRVFVYYGQLPCLSTLLQFETVEQFRAIRQVLEDLGLCKLNEKHLKPMRIKKQK